MGIHYPKYAEIGELNLESQEVIEKKTEALLKAMTEEEMMNLCHGAMSSPDNEKIANAGYLPGVPRLGIPEVRMFDGPAGVTSIYETTGLPTELTLSCSWDPELAEEYGEVEGSENVIISGNAQLGSQFDLVRTPQFTRNKDMMGEDPFLTSKLAVAEVKGIQKQKAMAVAKHFFAASNSANPMHAPDQCVDEQTLHELYFPPFERVVKEGNVAAIMSCYGKINGSYASENEYAQKEVLRNMWDFKGYTMSDWGGKSQPVHTKGNRYGDAFWNIQQQ